MILPSAPRLLLIDLSCWLHRFWHTTGRFAPRHCYSFFERVLGELESEYAAVCCDTQPPGFRHALYKHYKSNRPMPDQQLIQAERELRWLLEDAQGLPPVEAPGFEADDVIATLAARAQPLGPNSAEPGLSVVVLGLDKDIAQLVGVNLVLWDGKRKVTGPQEVLDKYGVGPSQMRDWQALVGDSTDNVPGAKGIGPKQATAILQAFGSLERAMTVSPVDFTPGECANIVNSSPATYRRLHASEDSIKLALELVTLRRDVPLGFESIEQLRWKMP